MFYDLENNFKDKLFLDNLEINQIIYKIYYWILIWILNYFNSFFI